MAQFKLSWNNNPDTPIDSTSLSKFVDSFSNGPILFVDLDAVAPFGGENDDLLKISMGSAIGLRIPNTRAFFDFDNSLTSHNSQFTPTQSSNYIYSTYSEKNTGSLFIGDVSPDLLVNGGFEVGMNGWEGYINDGFLDNQFPVGSVDYSVGTANISVISTDAFPVQETNNSSVALATGSLGRVQIDQVLNLVGNNTVSFSFYYKSSGGLNVLISSGAYAFKDAEWTASSNAFYGLPDTGGKWVLYEIPNIDLTKITDKTAVKFAFYSEQLNSVQYVDSCRLDALSYCEPFGSNITANPVLAYDQSIMDLNKGTLSLNIMFKEIHDMDILRLTSISGDAFTLSYSQLADSLTFQMYNEATQAYVSISGAMSLLSNLNQWIKIVLTWDKTVGIFMQSSIFTLTKNLTPYTPNTNLVALAISQASPIAAYIDQMSIDYDTVDAVQMCSIVVNAIVPIPDTCCVYEFEDTNATIDSSYLDVGLYFQPLTTYYVWLYQTADGENANIIVSVSKTAPKNVVLRYARLFGSFKTDTNGVATSYGIWDIWTDKSHLTNISRLTVGGADTDSFFLDIRTTPEAQVNDMRIALSTNYTSDVQFRYATDTQNAGVPYALFNNTGWSSTDNIKQDENVISTWNYNGINNDFNITTYNAASSVIITSNEIKLVSGATDVKLDNLRVKGNTLYTATGTELIIDSTIENFANDMMLKSNNTVRMVSSNYSSTVLGNYTETVQGITTLTSTGNINVSATSGVINLDLITINGNNVYNSDDVNIYSTNGNVNINGTAAGYVSIDTLKVTANKMYVSTGDMILQAPGNITIGLPDTTPTTVTIDSNAFIVNSDTITFKNLNALEFMSFDDIQISKSSIFTNAPTNMYLSSAANLNIHAQQAVIVDSLTPAVNINTVLNNAGLITANGGVQINGDLAVTGVTTLGSNLSIVSLSFSGVNNADESKIYTTVSGPNSSTVWEFGNDTTDSLVFRTSNAGTLTDAFVINGDSITINKNLIVNGTTTTMDAVNTVVSDKVFTINVGQPVVNQDSSYAVARTNGNAQLYWSESGKCWNVDNGGGIGNPDGSSKNIVYIGYNDQLVPANTSIVTLDTTGFLAQNNNANAGIELLYLTGSSTPNSVPAGGEAAGQAVFNVGINTGDFIANCAGFPTPGGGWMSVDTRNTNNDAVFNFYIKSSTQQANYKLVSFARASAQINSALGVSGLSTLASLNVPGDATFASTGTVEMNGTTTFASAPTFSTGATIHGTLTVANMVITGGADIAECWLKDPGVYNYGQVVVRTATGFRLSEKRAEKATLGVISSTYGSLYNGTLFNKEDFVGSKGLPIGLAGTVPVSLHGTAEIGDELVSWKDGKAIKANWFEKVFARERILGLFDGYKEGSAILRIK